MKPPSNAPFYACLYVSLSELARAHGYALSIHGSMDADLDLLAIPWIEEASEAEVLYQAMMTKLSAVDYRGLLQRDCGSWADDAKLDELVRAERIRNPEPRGPLDCALKPHGRKAWNLYLEHGCKVDLSVMPKLNTEHAN